MIDAKKCVLLFALLVTTGQAQTFYRPYYQPVPSYYTPAPVNRLDRKVDGHDQYNVGRSAEPPTSEADKLFMVLITNDEWQQNERERNLVSWMNYNPRLSKLRGSTRFNWYYRTSPHFKDRLRYKLGEALPIVAITRPDGEVLLNVTAISMPATAGELADMADDAVNARYAAPSFPGQLQGGQAVSDCPNCDPVPPAQPAPDDGQVDPIPEVLPSKPVNAAGLYVVIGIFVLAGFVVLLILACFGAGGRASSANRIFP